MPNIDTILAPFAIIGNACSGTSLVSRVLSNHSQCTFTGESVDLIHSVWKSLELFPARGQLEIPEAIRHHFLRLFPGESQYWLHVSAGIPMAWSTFDSEEGFLEWYWEVSNRVFPQAKYFAVLQDPLAALVSSRESAAGSFESITNSHRLVARIITHSRSRVRYAVNYHDLIQDPRHQVAQLLKYLGMEFEESCLVPFDVPNVARGAEEPRNPHELQSQTADALLHRDQWERIPHSMITTAYRDAVDACWAKFDLDFGGWPC